MKTIVRTPVDLKRGCVEETAVEEGLETDLVEWMGGLVDRFGHVRVVEPSPVVEMGLEEDLSKSDSHHIESSLFLIILPKSTSRRRKFLNTLSSRYVTVN